MTIDGVDRAPRPSNWVHQRRQRQKASGVTGLPGVAAVYLGCTDSPDPHPASVGSARSGVVLAANAADVRRAVRVVLLNQHCRMAERTQY